MKRTEEERKALKAAQGRRDRLKNKERIVAQQRAWYVANKDKVGIRVKEWSQTNKELRNVYSRTYSAKHPDRVVKSRATYWERNQERLKERSRKNNSKLKSDVISKYGGKCAACGFKDMAGLSIDHINGGGSKERRTLSGRTLYARLRREAEIRADLRVLCMTCQWMARTYGSDFTKWPKQKEQESEVRTVFSWTANGTPIDVESAWQTEVKV